MKSEKGITLIALLVIIIIIFIGVLVIKIAYTEYKRSEVTSETEEELEEELKEEKTNKNADSSLLFGSWMTEKRTTFYIYI